MHNALESSFLGPSGGGNGTAGRLGSVRLGREYTDEREPWEGGDTLHRRTWLGETATPAGTGRGFFNGHMDPCNGLTHHRALRYHWW